MKRNEPKSQSGPSREELIVGAGRHAKPKSGRARRWFVDFGGWVFSGLLIVVVLVTIYVIPAGDKNRGRDLATLANLVVVGVPKKVWAAGSSSKLQSVQVRISNSGQASAEDVQVIVLLGAVRAQLAGPAQIAPGESEIYGGKVDLVLRPGQELQVSMECANCLNDLDKGLASP